MRNLMVPPPRRALVDRADLVEDVLRLREATLLEAGEDELVVDVDVEDALLSLHQLGIDAVLLLDLVGELRGSRKVAAGHTVLDLHRHGESSVRGWVDTTVWMCESAARIRGCP